MGTNAKLSQRIRAMLALPDDDTSCDKEVQRLSSWYQARLARYGEQAATVFLFNEVRRHSGFYAAVATHPPSELNRS